MQFCFLLAVFRRLFYCFCFVSFCFVMRSTWAFYCLFVLSGPLSMIIPHLVSVVQSSLISAVIQSCFVLGLTSSSSICSCVSICPSLVTVADSSAASISTCVKIKIFNVTCYCDTMIFLWICATDDSDKNLSQKEISSINTNSPCHMGRIVQLSLQCISVTCGLVCLSLNTITKYWMMTNNE